MAALDATFSFHAVLTAMHIIPAAIFVLLATGVLLRRTSGTWLERLFFFFGAITGVTAYAMSPTRSEAGSSAPRSSSSTHGICCRWAEPTGSASAASPHDSGSG